MLIPRSADRGALGFQQAAKHFRPRGINRVILCSDGVANTGITAASGCACYAGIPLTHRKFASSVAFVTGHEDPTHVPSSIDWSSLAGGGGTLVFLMGVKNLPHIVRQLDARHLVV